MLGEQTYNKKGRQITKSKDICWLIQSLHSVYFSFYDLAFCFINISQQLTFGSDGLKSECFKNLNLQE